MIHFDSKTIPKKEELLKKYPNLKEVWKVKIKKGGYKLIVFE